MKNQNYYLGLDIGTDSAGYAVTDTEYNLLKKGGEPMWGVTLFDEAQLNTDRRAFRVGRRRLDRRQQRVSLIQELFAAEIGKIDPRFFIRMQESALYRDDAQEPFSLFNDKGYTDKDYHRQYPTIHHLIHELMTGKEPHDVRLVYLACAWLVAHRGHFLSDISRDNISAVSDFSAVYSELVNYILAQDSEIVIPWSEDQLGAVANTLRQKISITAKYKKLLPLLFASGKAPKAADHFPYQTDLLIKALCGSKISAEDLFMNSAYAEVPSFSLGSDDAVLEDVMDKLGDDAGLILRLKAVYDWSLLVGILNGHATISAAKVAVYEQHKADLAGLKAFIRKYAPQKYAPLFRDITADNYTGYTYHMPEKADSVPIKKRATKDAFCDALRKIVSGIVPGAEDQAFYDDMMDRLASYSFLPKQKDSENRVIPYQLYWFELHMLLLRASAYLPFLNETDASGLTVREKIISVFLFRVPYYVGPLNTASPFAWVVRKPEKITPWNFSQVVDEDASEQQFINRMLNTCTYLPDQKVLPRESLLYHRFTVLNEINNIRVNGTPIPVELKQQLYQQVFMTRRKVTRKAIVDFLMCNNAMTGDDLLSGIDEQIHSDLRPYHDFARLLSSGLLTEDQVEDIIARLTYTEDPARIKKIISARYPALPQKDIDYICRLKYKDFGRLSQHFLASFEGVCKETGEITTIMAELWNTNRNLMELLSDHYTFTENINALRQDWYAAHPLTLEQQLDELRLSNAVKRPVLRALQITKEVVKATGKAPEKIFVEVTRGATADQKNKRTASRQQQIRELYAKCDHEDIRVLTQQLDALGEKTDNMLRSDALFLYYMQLGKCLYTGRSITPEELKSNTCNIEHIYPQSKVKDDSIINNRILVDSVANGEKSDTYPVDAEIRHKMASFWVYLHDHGFMSDEKYHRLTRGTTFTEEELLGFINRQLTETSQSVKATATILRQLYPTAKIVYAKASLTSEFRQAYDLLKSRAFNDLHHAKDAYLNIVTGNVYDTRFSSRWFSVDQQYTLNVKALFGDKPVICGGVTVWPGASKLADIKKTVAKNNAHMTRYAFCRHGGFFDQMPVKAAPGLVPRKQTLPTEKYGGYNKPGVSFFVPVRYRCGKKSDVMIMSVELLHSARFLADPDFALAYARTHIGEILGKAIDEVSFPLKSRILKINTVISLDGFRVCLAGSASGGRTLIAAPFMPFSAGAEWQNYLKRLERLVEKSASAKNYVFDERFDKVSAEKNLQLYDLYVDKLNNSIYAKRVNAPVKIFEGGREKFVALSPIDQARALLNMHSVFGRISGGIDLTLIGGSARAAATVSFSNIVSNWTKTYQHAYIIETSASGLWEQQTVDLLSLL